PRRSLAGTTPPSSAAGRPPPPSPLPLPMGRPPRPPPPAPSLPRPHRSLEERTVKQLRLTKALTLPEATAVSEACRRMAARRADAALLTDAQGVLSGIVTAEDISGRVIAEGLRPEETSMAKVMTPTPVFVMSNSSATEALQKMVQGKFRHLPVVEHGTVTAMLDITKFLWGAISRMEQAAEHGSAIAAAMEGVERQWGNEFAGPHAFIENLRDQMFKPSLSTIITENSREHIARDPHLHGFGLASSGTKSVPRGDPCRKGGQIVACLDALQLTHASISMVEGASGRNDVANAMVQKFWDSALAVHPAEEYDEHSFRELG
uniref:CBS domain-containing protein n=1 Tax=Aegilops tauschii subsp. strangulata TaxID=200361 RepID=A0A453GF26_AEGTS